MTANSITKVTRSPRSGLVPGYGVVQEEMIEGLVSRLAQAYIEQTGADIETHVHSAK